MTGLKVTTIAALLLQSLLLSMQVLYSQLIFLNKPLCIIETNTAAEMKVTTSQTSNLSVGIKKDVVKAVSEPAVNSPFPTSLQLVKTVGLSFRDPLARSLDGVIYEFDVRSHNGNGASLKVSSYSYRSNLQFNCTLNPGKVVDVAVFTDRFYFLTSLVLQQGPRHPHYGQMHQYNRSTQACGPNFQVQVAYSGGGNAGQLQNYWSLDRALAESGSTIIKCSQLALVRNQVAVSYETANNQFLAVFSLNGDVVNNIEIPPATSDGRCDTSMAENVRFCAVDDSTVLLMYPQACMFHWVNIGSGETIQQHNYNNHLQHICFQHICCYRDYIIGWSSNMLAVHDINTGELYCCF